MAAKIHSEDAKCGAEVRHHRGQSVQGPAWTMNQEQGSVVTWPVLGSDGRATIRDQDIGHRHVACFDLTARDGTPSWP